MKKTCLLLLCWLLCQLAGAQQSNENYIRTRTMLDASGSKYIESVQYFDGLGRPTVLVQKGVTPSGDNLISLQEYDALGRELKSWLSVPSSSDYLSPTAFKSAADGYYGPDERPYGQNEYEASPLNRVLKTYGPGKDWETHPANVAYLTNTASGELACKHYQVNSSGALTENGYYAAGQLYVLKSTDEDGRVSYQFTDILGQQLLSRRISSGVSHDTYFVYDDFGNKRFVLPPAYQDDPNLDLYAYQYKYDGRNREIETKLPGCEAIYKVYDKADKLIYTQDGVQRGKGEWSFNLYDDFGRVIAGGVCKTKSVENVSQYVVTAKINPKLLIAQKPNPPVAVRNGISSPPVVCPPGITISPGLSVQTVFFGDLTCQTNAALSSAEIHYVNFYDNYFFLKQNAYENRDHFPEATVNATGYQTGSLVRILGSDKILAKAIYYDIKGRPVREVAQNDMGGYDVRTTEYTFTGKPLTAHHSQTEYKDRGIVANFAHNFNEKYTYTYDHAERLTKVVHQMDNSAPVTLAENHYDELGRLTEKRLHGNDQLTIYYAYNLRDWVESIDSPHFKERLYYTKGGGSHQYGGNISSMQWWTSGSQGFHKYSFSYDGLNRLRSANYAYSMSMIGGKSQYSVYYTYDKMGNITNLLRHGLAAQPSIYRPIDDLDLWYNGNQLRKVTDHVTATNPLYNSAFNYVDGSNEEQEFFYDGNGNMTKDLDKGISIEYNTLGLASKVQTDGMDVLYKYAADGTKLQTSYSYPATIVQPLDSLFADSVIYVRPGGPLVADSLIRKSQVVLPASSAPLLSQPVTSTQLTGISKSYYYVQNAIRSNFGLLNDNLRTVFTEEGYITFSGKTPVYHYYLQDHQGNNRVVVNQDGTVEQITHYYPFGGWFGESTNPTHQNFKYGGKELDLTAGLNTYDFSARTQRPDLGVFTTMDPLCEKYYDCSPYAYCMNNPMRFIDPTGKDVWELKPDGTVTWIEESEKHTMYALNKDGERTGAFITISNRNIFDQLTEIRSKDDYNGIYAISSSNEVGDVFLFAANNTGVEWALEGYQGEKGRQYVLSTEKIDNEVGFRDNSREGLTMANQFFGIHSHPASNGTEGGSGYGSMYGGDRKGVINNYYKAQEQKIPLPAYYVYHKYSKTLYQYNPWVSNIYIKKVTDNKGLRFIIPKR